MNEELDSVIIDFIESLNNEYDETWYATERKISRRVMTWFSDYLFKNNITIIIKK